MKTKNLRATSGLFRAGSLLLIMFMLVQCVGPRGPRGYDGNDGLDGLDGTATYSALYDIEPAEWDGDFNGYYVFLDVPEITDDIYYNGAVLVYRLIEQNPKSFNMLPYTYVSDGFMIYMDYDAYVGGIDVVYKEIDNGLNDTYAPDGLMTFKVLVIEGIPLATVKEMVDVKDFNAVVKTFKIDVNREGYHIF